MSRSMQVYDRVDQAVYRDVLENGLQVLVLAKPGYEKKYATFATRYGGMDVTFVRPGDSQPTETPAGIAHFLEHKMFEEPDGVNVLQKFSYLGASPNAYTGQYYTVYLASMVDNFREGLDLLLDYVQNPYFTDENVAKEQGIIEQEIQMGLDHPGRMVYYNFLESLYQRHPARLRVIGTVESIRQITKELLYLCHDTFYHPSNMVVVVAGDVEPEAVFEQVRRDMEGRDYQRRPPVQRAYAEEPDGVVQPEVRHRMKVSRPQVQVGFKVRLPREVGEEARSYHRRLVAADLALEAVLGKGTRLYWRLYEDGTITDRYGFGLSSYPQAGGIGHIAAGGESEKPDRFAEEITEALQRAAAGAFDVEAFEEARRNEIGQMLAVLDNPESLVHALIVYGFDGLDFLERREVLDEVTVDDALAFLRSAIRPENRVVSIVEPLEPGAGSRTDGAVQGGGARA